MRKQVLKKEIAKGLHAQSLLRWGQSEFHRLLEKLPAGAYMCDAAGLITYYNRRAAEIWGREPKLNDPEDRYCGSFKLFSADGSPIRHDQCWMALALQTEKEYNGREILIERPDGHRLTALAHANPIRAETGALLGAVNVLVDISERKRAEDALWQADRAKDEFLATLAHELRNPLAPIRNAIQILRLREQSTEESQWALGVIDRQMEQMTRLIDDLLDVSRISRNALALRRERIDLREVIRLATETSRPQIEAGGHELILERSPEPIYLDADCTRLAQVLSNLLNNAAKYTERGGLIRLAAERQGNDVVVRVCDNGIGIPVEMLPRVFDLFTQVDRSMERTQGGLGIGLTLVRRLVEMHGGSIHAYSEGANTGSEFTIRLPVVCAPPEEPSVSPPHAGPEAAVRASSLRVLVVDDNRDSAASLDILLRMVGNDVRTVHDGLDALALASEYRPDVIVLDIGLPGMNGYEVAQAIRQQSWSRNTLLIAVTGWGQESDKQRAIAAGLDHHLVKPVDPAVLLEMLASFAKTASDPVRRRC
jgi:PAS domain S-box-containing protein